MPVTPSHIAEIYGRSSPYEALFGGPIARLKRQRKPDAKPKKPKPVTDEQLLAIVQELEAKIDAVSVENTRLAIEIVQERTQRGERIQWLRDHVSKNYKLKLFAPIKSPGYPI